jgi:HEAT repeat protein
MMTETTMYQMVLTPAQGDPVNALIRGESKMVREVAASALKQHADKMGWSDYTISESAV